MLEVYKQKQLKLHAKILKNISKDDRLKKGYDMLGVLKGNDIVVNNQEEVAAAFDFNIYEKIEDNKNAVELYIENCSFEDEIEEQMLKSMHTANTSLYKVVNINAEKNIIELRDILNSDEKIEILDTELYKSCGVDSIVYTRIIKMDKFNITSGMAMVFDGNHKDYLLRRSKKIGKKINIENEDIKKFISFFQLYREEKH